MKADVCEVKEDVLARRQLRGRGALGNLAGFIALLVGALGPALSKQIGAFAGHGWACGWLMRRRLAMRSAMEMVKNTRMRGPAHGRSSAVAGSREQWKQSRT